MVRGRLIFNIRGKPVPLPIHRRASECSLLYKLFRACVRFCAYSFALLFWAHAIRTLNSKNWFKAIGNFIAFLLLLHCSIVVGRVWAWVTLIGRSMCWNRVWRAQSIARKSVLYYIAVLRTNCSVMFSFLIPFNSTTLHIGISPQPTAYTTMLFVCFSH